MPTPLLEIDDLRCAFQTREGPLRVLNGVSLTVHAGEVLAIVGESGCGKTTLGLSILRLLPSQAEIVGGAILFRGRDVLRASEDDLRRLRGRAISMIFQDPVAGLNPVLPIGKQVEEILATHLDLPRKERKRRAIELLASFGLSEPARLMSQYPFHLSGGMCQRVMIAMATALNPELIIADEPTAALDVTVQAQILTELNALRDQRGAAVLLITHDLGVVAQMADRVAVMYAGAIVECGSVETIFRYPRHPYTAALLATLPRLDERRQHLTAIPGTPPSLLNLPNECPFIPRCSKTLSQCRLEPAPPLEELASGQFVACYNPIFQDWAAADR